MSPSSNRRVPSGIFFLIGTMIGFPFLLLVFFTSPLSGTWLKFVVPVLPFAALPLLWLWARDSRSEGSNAIAQEAYPPGA